LCAYPEGEQPARQEEEERGGEIQDTDLLVIGRRDPFEDPAVTNAREREHPLEGGHARSIASCGLWGVKCARRLRQIARVGAWSERGGAFVDATGASGAAIRLPRGRSDPPSAPRGREALSPRGSRDRSRRRRRGKRHRTRAPQTA